MKTKYTIKRNVWVCGGWDVKPFGESALLNDNKRMCCLGQICKQAGATDDDILDLGSPGGLADRLHLEVVTVEDTKKFKKTRVFKNIAWLLNVTETETTQHDGSGFVPRILLSMEDSDIAEKMMNINDDGVITQAKREKGLAKWAAKAGIELKYTGKLLKKEDTTLVGKKLYLTNSIEDDCIGTSDAEDIPGKYTIEIDSLFYDTREIHEDCRALK